VTDPCGLRSCTSVGLSTTRRQFDSRLAHCALHGSARSTSDFNSSCRFCVQSEARSSRDPAAVSESPTLVASWKLRNCILEAEHRGQLIDPDRRSRSRRYQNARREIISQRRVPSMRACSLPVVDRATSNQPEENRLHCQGLVAWVSNTRRDLHLHHAPSPWIVPFWFRTMEWASLARTAAFAQSASLTPGPSLYG
jgi:hypothetical protein